MHAEEEKKVVQEEQAVQKVPETQEVDQEEQATTPKENPLTLESAPRKTTYKPGETISFAGLVIKSGDKDVTDRCKFNVAEGTQWRKDDRTLEVSARYGANSVNFTLKRKTSIVVPIVIVAIVAAIIGGGIAAWFAFQPKEEPTSPDAGSKIIPQGNMSDEEAQRMLDEQAEKSRITISVAPDMQLKSDGSLRVNFIVPEPNNGLSERLEIEQDGKVVYKSGIVQPGYKIEWGEGSVAKEGSATATVYAVSSEGNDSGNPISVEVNVVKASE